MQPLIFAIPYVCLFICLFVCLPVFLTFMPRNLVEYVVLVLFQYSASEIQVTKFQGKALKTRLIKIYHQMKSK